MSSADPVADQKWPGGYTGECNPDTWNEKAKPVQSTEKKPGQLTQAQVDEYFREGVVLIEGYFSPHELEPIKNSIAELVDFVANGLYEEGKITNKYENEGFYQRLTLINRDFPGANVILHKLGIMPETIRSLWGSDKLCNAVEQLIGPDFGGHPIWNLRTKTPQDEASTVPWHQDVAYQDTSSYNKHIVGAWIPLVDTDATNGCMEFAIRGHKKGMVARHECCDGDTHYVMLQPETMRDSLDIDLDKDIKVMPVKYGSMLLFNNIIPHRSLNNLTGFPGEIRWSLDLRWQDYRHDWGFFGLAKGIKFRTSEDPTWRPSQDDWDAFLNLARRTKYKGALDDNTFNAEVLKDSFSLDTTIVGPWMHNWELSHKNKHTDAMTDHLDSIWRTSISDKAAAQQAK